MQEKLSKMGLEPKAMLLLDNCSAHRNEEELISTDGNVVAKFLHPNVTSLIQPMDQAVLVSIKRRYQGRSSKSLSFRMMMAHRSFDQSIFLKGINILKVSEMITASWNEIKPKTLGLSWRKILPLEDDEDSQGSEEPEGDPSAAGF